MVAVAGGADNIAPVMTDLVDGLVSSGRCDFAAVAEALQSFVVAHQPMGVGAVLDIGPDPIGFLFDQAQITDQETTHRGEGRMGWNTIFVAGAQATIMAGAEEDFYRDPSDGWALVWAGTVPGGGAKVPLTAGAAAPATPAEPLFDEPTPPPVAEVHEDSAPIFGAPEAGAAVATAGAAAGAAALGGAVLGSEATDTDDEPTDDESANLEPAGVGPVDDELPTSDGEPGDNEFVSADEIEDMAAFTETTVMNPDDIEPEPEAFGLPGDEPAGTDVAETEDAEGGNEVDGELIDEADTDEPTADAAEEAPVDQTEGDDTSADEADAADETSADKVATDEVDDETETPSDATDEATDEDVAAGEADEPAGDDADEPSTDPEDAEHTADAEDDAPVTADAEDSEAETAADEDGDAEIDRRPKRTAMSRSRLTSPSLMSLSRSRAI